VKQKEQTILKSGEVPHPFLIPFFFAIYGSALGKQRLNLRGIPLAGGFLVWWGDV
jgi:hypothetical protein